MEHELTLVGAQSRPVTIGRPLDTFEQAARALSAGHPDAGMLVWPELHLFADGEPDRARPEVLRAAAEPVDGPRVEGLSRIARRLGVWMIPGSVCELGPAGELFNTALVFAPDGRLVCHYRKIFPWRPTEPYTPGGDFAVFDVDGVGRFGLCICFDSWFPEVARNLAWLGAETILNVVKTTTADRDQEMVIARANAIVQQVNFVSVNTAGPVGMGRSAAFGPQGETLDELTGADEGALVAAIRHDEVHRVRREGTAGVTRPWDFFRPGDAAVSLPAYRGSIDPQTWNKD